MQNKENLNQEQLKIGDTLIATRFCGFPDNTTKDKEYNVSKIETGYNGGSLFWIIDDEGEERLPIVTAFKRK